MTGASSLLPYATSSTVCHWLTSCSTNSNSGEPEVWLVDVIGTICFTLQGVLVVGMQMQVVDGHERTDEVGVEVANQPGSRRLAVGPPGGTEDVHAQRVVEGLGDDRLRDGTALEGGDDLGDGRER